MYAVSLWNFTEVGIRRSSNVCFISLHLWYICKTNQVSNIISWKRSSDSRMRKTRLARFSSEFSISAKDTLTHFDTLRKSVDVPTISKICKHIFLIIRVTPGWVPTRLLITLLTYCIFSLWQLLCNNFGLNQKLVDFLNDRYYTRLHFIRVWVHFKCWSKCIWLM